MHLHVLLFKCIYYFQLKRSLHSFSESCDLSAPNGFQVSPLAAAVFYLPIQNKALEGSDLKWRKIKLPQLWRSFQFTAGSTQRCWGATRIKPFASLLSLIVRSGPKPVPFPPLTPAGRKSSKRLLKKNEIFTDILVNALQVAHVPQAGLRWHSQTRLKLAPSMS